MSHEFCLHCPRHNKSSEGFNKFGESLRKAVEESYPLFLLSKTGWDARNVDYDIYNSGLASFIIDHWECGGFEIHGEYKDDPIIEVKPLVDGYANMILPNVIADAEKVRDHLSRVIESAKENDPADDPKLTVGPRITNVIG